VPYLPTVTLLGSDILDTNPALERNDGLVQVQALKPDVAVLHVQRADAAGRAHGWGPMGIAEEAGLAAERVILTAEEIVGEDVTLSDPNRILLPETKIVAVVREPGGAHPSPVQGHWRRDHAFYRDYAQSSRSEDGFRDWLEEWVLGVPDRAAYLGRIDQHALRISRHRLSVPVDYGDE
jgi:glutaconate CoA-transferase, subunit A